MNHPLNAPDGRGGCGNTTSLSRRVTGLVTRIVSEGTDP